MNKAAIASLLAVSAFAAVPGLVSPHGFAAAQAPAASGQVQMDAAESAVYDNAMNKITDPAAQAPALEDYLTKYPKSGVKDYVLQKIMIDYSQVNSKEGHAKAVTAADNVLASSPDNLQAYVIEVAYRREAADAQTDPAAKQAGLDAAADYAKKGLSAKKPASMDDAGYQALKAFATPTFYSTIGEDALNKKDGPGAVAAFTAELAAMKPDQLSTPAALQEAYYLAQAYYVSTPPDYINCTFYATRAASLAPDQFKPQLQPLADYCYKKYHGTKDGYDAIVTIAKSNATPPADFNTKITPAPTDADQVNKLMSDTAEADLPKLAVSDKEYVLQYGTPAQADKVFDTVKGKVVEIPDATVITATADQLQVAVSDDAVQSKTADFTFNMKAPLKTVPAAGEKVTLSGTYASYTQKPVMIVMSDAEVVVKEKPKAPVKRTTPARRKG